MTDRERYLKVASPKVWDEWLSYMADVYAPKSIEDNSIYFFEPIEIYDCPFCIAFDGNCKQCMYRSFTVDISHCLDIPRLEKIDRAIEKLEKAGVFKED